MMWLSKGFVAEHLQAGTSQEIIVQLGRLLLLGRNNAFPWMFFDPVESLYGLKMTTSGFALTAPEPLRAKTARVLWDARRKLRRFYVYPFLTLPLIATVVVGLAFFASPVAVTVAVAMGAATFAATAIAAQLVNQHVKELDEVFSTLKPALPASPTLPSGGAS